MSDNDLRIDFGNLADVAIDHAFEIIKLRVENARLRQQLSEARQQLVDAGVQLAESEMESKATGPDYDNALGNMADD
jgi:regulator of replication initiation timing